MNDIQKIRQLWRYLKVKQNEKLIIPLYNEEKAIDEYLVVTMPESTMCIEISESKPKLDNAKSFHLIQRIGDGGKHIMPSVDQIKQDEKMDY